MQPESFVQLIGSGNVATVEEEWMKVVESPRTPLGRLADYQVVLAELKRLGKSSQAESLAWTAIETLSSKHDPVDLLKVAGPFLLSLGDSTDLRKQVADMYRAAYTDREGIDSLLAESGIAGGRPVRRALRALDVCLNVQEGGYLCSREENRAAKVVRIDRSSWEFTISHGRDEESLGAVLLADAYHNVSATDFHVLRHFAPHDLQQRMESDPASVVIDLCRRRDNKIDSEALERLLVPGVLSAAAWKKWWTKARTALKQHPNVSLDGRSIVTITYQSGELSHEDSLWKEFEQKRDPHEQLAVVERYVRDGKDHGGSPGTPILKTCYEAVVEKARRLTQQRAAAAGVHWFVAARIGELAGIENSQAGALDYLRQHPDVTGLIQHLGNDSLVEAACAGLRDIRPEEWKPLLLGMLPGLPTSACASIASSLLKSGCTKADFAPVVQQVLAAPLQHFDALLWLWNMAGKKTDLHDQSLITLLLRILRTLEDARRSDFVPRDTVKDISARARAVLPARKYERFVECLSGMEPSMGLTLKTQISRSETLGRAVREDMLKLISQHFPSFDVLDKTPDWKRADVLFVTDSGLMKKQEEVEYHLNVKMKENARAIGRAAELGDLSENSEYKFALEERDLLRARLAQMNAELEIAKIIDVGKVPTDEIGVGTHAVFERVADSRRYEMSFMGPWEADLERGMINYLAPLAQKLMGKRVGDEVEFDHANESGLYRVVELRNGLQDD